MNGGGEIGSVVTLAEPNMSCRKQWVIQGKDVGSISSRKAGKSGDRHRILVTNTSRLLGVCVWGGGTQSRAEDLPTQQNRGAQMGRSEGRSSK